MNYQEWLEWRKTIDPAKESRQEGCILSISTAAEKIKEEGSKEFGEKTAAYGMALNTLYLGDEYVTEEEWQKAYVTAYDYVNNELKNEDNFKELITTGIESSSMGENARDLFINLEEVNRDLELNADLKWYAEKNNELNPNAGNDIAELLGVQLAPREQQQNIDANLNDDDFEIVGLGDEEKLDTDGNVIDKDGNIIRNANDDDDFEIVGLDKEEKLDTDGNIIDNDGNIIRNANERNEDYDLDLNENLNINQLIEEKNAAAEQHQNAPYEEDELENDATEPVNTDDYDVITNEEVEEAEQETAALIAKKEAERKELLEEQKKQLKEAAEKAKKEKEETAAKKKKEAEEAKKDKLEREKKRRERTYEVKDDLKREKSENAYLKDLFKDEKEELNAKHGNWIRGTNTEVHDDLVDAYDKFMRSLNTKNPKYSRDIKSKRKMKLKETAMEYVRMKKEMAKLNGDKNTDDPDWEPKTRMGRRRFRSAKAIIEKLERFETDYDRLVMFEDDLTAKRTIGASGSSDDHADLSRSFKSLKNFLKYEDRNSDPALKQKLMNDLRRDAERYLKNTAGTHIDDPQWQPSTKMGKRRFAAAKAIIIRLNQMEGKTLNTGKKLNAPNKPNEAEQALDYVNNYEENRRRQANAVNNAVGNNTTNINQQRMDAFNRQRRNSSNQQPLNNDDMRNDLPEEMKLENEENQIRRSNSITPKSRKLDRFKEEHERKVEKEIEKLDSHLDEMDVTSLKGATKNRKKRDFDHKDGAVIYNGKVLTRVSHDNMKSIAGKADTKEKLVNTFTDLCAIMVASGNFAKSTISEDEMMQSKEALKNNKEFMDKVRNMPPDELSESIKKPAEVYRKINRDISAEKYNKMLESNKQSSLAAPPNDITAQQYLYLNSVAIEHAMVRGDYSPNAIENSLKIITANEDFMAKFNMMENNELKKGIQDPLDSYKSFKARDELIKVPRDIDIQSNKQDYQYRAENHIDSLDRISARSCVNAMDKLKKLADSNQPLTEQQTKEAKHWMAVMVTDQYIRTDINGSMHNQFRKTKKKYFENIVKVIAGSPEYQEALPKEIDADYIKNFLADKNSKGPRYLTDAVKKNSTRNKELRDQRLQQNNLQKSKNKKAEIQSLHSMV